MKKIIALFLALILTLALPGCGKSEEEAAPGALPPVIMVEGVIYADTGKESNTINRKDGFDGEITTSVKGGERPTENDQSNFGTGYGYQFGELEGTVDLYINGKWWIYADEEANEQISYPERYAVMDKTPKLTVTYGDQSIDEPRIGVLSWEYTKEDGSKGAKLGDGAHPLDAKHASPFITLDPYAQEPFEIWLHWDLLPDSVLVRYWGEECWGQLEAEPAGRSLLKEGNEAGDAYCLVPQVGNYIYEVIASWENAPNYSGKVCYNFHAVMTDEEPTAQMIYEKYLENFSKVDPLYMDLNQDGEPELVIDYRNSSEVAIVTIVDGEPVMVMDRSCTFLCEDGIIGKWGEGSGGETVCYYRMDGQETVLVDVVVSPSNELSWYHTSDPNAQLGTTKNMDRISKEEGQKICARYRLWDDSMPFYLTNFYPEGT